MQNISTSPVAPSQSDSFKAIADQFNAFVSKNAENGDDSLKRMQLHQFILSCAHLKSGLEKRLRERKICRQNEAEAKILPSSLTFALSSVEKKEPLKVALFFGDQTIQIEANQGKEEIHLLLSGSTLTAIFSSLPIDGDLLEPILKALPEANLQILEMIENKSSFPLTAKALLSFAKLCPHSLPHLLTICGRHPHLVDLRLDCGDQKVYTSREILAFIWPKLALFLQKLAFQTVENDRNKQVINLAAATISLRDIQSGLAYITGSISPEKLAGPHHLNFFKIFCQLGDLKRAAISLAYLQEWMASAPLPDYPLLQSWIQALIPLQLSYSALNEELRSLLDSTALLLNHHCDRYIYRQLTSEANPDQIASFQLELAEMSPFVKALGHNWHAGPLSPSGNSITENLPLSTFKEEWFKKLSPLKEVETLYFHSIDFVSSKNEVKSSSTLIFNLLQKCFPQVSSLTLIDCKFNRKGLAALAKWEQLETLTFNRCLSVGSQRVKHNYLEHLQFSPRLKNLCLIECANLKLSFDLNWIKESQLHSLALNVNQASRGISSMGSLGPVSRLHLDISSHSDSFIWVSPLLKGIKESPHLQELSLYLSHSFPFIPDLDIANPKVAQLKINFKTLTELNILDICSLIGFFPNLEQLEINADLSSSPHQALDFIDLLNRRPAFKKLIVSHDASDSFLMKEVALPLNFAFEKASL